MSERLQDHKLESKIHQSVYTPPLNTCIHNFSKARAFLEMFRRMTFSKQQAQSFNSLFVLCSMLVPDFSLWRIIWYFLLIGVFMYFLQTQTWAISTHEDLAWGSNPNSISVLQVPKHKPLLSLAGAELLTPAFLGLSRREPRAASLRAQPCAHAAVAPAARHRTPGWPRCGLRERLHFKVRLTAPRLTAPHLPEESALRSCLY